MPERLPGLLELGERLGDGHEAFVRLVYQIAQLFGLRFLETLRHGPIFIVPLIFREHDINISLPTHASRCVNGRSAEAHAHAQHARQPIDLWVLDGAAGARGAAYGHDVSLR